VTVLSPKTLAACGLFAAISGSSIATAATMTKVAMPPMRRLGYHDRLSTGAVASGGVLGVLIPPSVPLVIFGGPGSASRATIGVVVIFGVAFSTLLSLFVVPAFYAALAKYTRGSAPA